MKKILLSLMAMLFVCVMASTAQTVSGNVGGHDYVDLGLPSGTLWATCNVGATKPTECGDYFAWGETSPKGIYTTKNYKFFKLKGYNIDEITKYNTESKYGIVDDKTVLESQDDVASVLWDGSWRMPTYDELQELENGCDWEWSDNYEDSGVAGRIGTSKSNGNTIFLPAAGCCFSVFGLDRKDQDGCYWSSSLYSKSLEEAHFLSFYSREIRISYGDRFVGRPIRAVCSKK